MAERTCRYGGCDGFIRLRQGLCNKHYARLKRGTLDREPKPERKCSKCESKHYAKGLCRRHYEERPARVRKVCTQCGGPHKARGLCMRHYEEWRRRQHGIPAAVPRPEICTLKDCFEPHQARGLCNKHYRRAIRVRVNRPPTPPLTFKVEWCGRPGNRVAGDPNAARGMCSTHYRQALAAEKRAQKKPVVAAPPPPPPPPQAVRTRLDEKTTVVHWPPVGEGEWTCPTCGGRFPRRTPAGSVAAA